MTHSINNENRIYRVSDLTEEEVETIIEDLLENPVETISISRDDTSSNIFFGVLEMEGRYVAIAHDDGESSMDSLSFGESFETEEEAEAKAMEWAEKTLIHDEDESSSQIDDEWNRSPDASEELVGPFTFRDNTDHTNGYEMEDLEDVFSFFSQDDALFEPDNWGNHYSCSLLDANGAAFWVTRNSARDMKAYKV